MKEKSNDDNKVLFINRVLAFIIDMFIISMLTSLIAIPFTNTSKVNDINDKLTKVTQEYSNKKVSSEEYNIEISNIVYDLYREEGASYLIRIVLVILYFVVFQTYNNGQTLGKMLFKMRVTSDNGDISINQMIFRAFINDFLFLYLLSFVFLLVLPRRSFYTCLVAISGIQYVILLVSTFMIMIRRDGRGIHDLVCSTRVVSCK